jgi:hypothetical protein
MNVCGSRGCSKLVVVCPGFQGGCAHAASDWALLGGALLLGGAQFIMALRLLKGYCCLSGAGCCLAATSSSGLKPAFTSSST